MLDEVAPARSRVLRGGSLLVVLAVAVAVLLDRGRGATPVAQRDLGPVLLVPGYGGDVAALAPLADALTGAGRDVEVVGRPVTDAATCASTPAWWRKPPVARWRTAHPRSTSWATPPVVSSLAGSSPSWGAR